MDYTNKALGLRTQTQIPLNVKEYKESEESLKDLGLNDNLAFVYEKGLVVYCILEGTRYEWKEMSVGEIGLLDTNFVYPDDIITFGIDYSNKEYNFVKVEFGELLIPPFERVSDFSGSIIIRGRDESLFGPIGFQSIDFSRTDISNIDEYGNKADYSAILNGYYQRIQIGADNSIIGGGRRNTIDSIYSGIFSGNNHLITLYSDNSFIGGGSENIINNSLALSGGANAIVGGGLNLIDGRYSIIGGGYQNEIKNTAQYAGIFSGNNNEVDGNHTFIGGGLNNKTLRINSAILGGTANEARGVGSQVVGIGMIADSASEIALGEAGTTYTPASTTTYNINDRALNVGIGNFNLGILKDGFSVFKSGLATLPNTTNALITAEPTGKAIVTKEYLTSQLATKDGSETKINAGEGVSVTGIGTTISPYIISTPSNKVRNVGYFENFDPGGPSMALGVGGDITVANTVNVTTNDSIVTITFTNPMANLNYYIRTFIRSMSASINDDNDILTGVFKPISTTSASLAFREVTTDVQDVRVYIEIVQL